MAMAQKRSKSQFFVKIMAFVLAALMVFGMGGTLLYYLISM